MTLVSLVKCETDALEAVAEAMRLAEAADVVRPGDTVLVKPNLHGGHGFTAPRVIEATCRWAYGQGARRVYVGDGPFWGCPSEEAQEYREEIGFIQAAEAAGAEAVNLHDLPYRTLRPDDPDLPDEIGLSELLYECDAVINLPLLKTHFNTLVTIGVKNLKGCMRPQDKRRFHELELSAALAALAEIAAPLVSVTLLDATTAVEGMGPAAGTEVEMGLLAASCDLVAVEAVACDLAGIRPDEVRTTRECVRRDVGVADLALIEVRGESVDDHRRRFKRPFEEVRDHFPGLRIAADGACSGCAMGLFEALASILDSEAEVRVPAVAIGALARIEAGIAVGACAKNSGGHPYLPGCPPRTHDIRAALIRD